MTQVLAKGILVRRVSSFLQPRDALLSRGEKTRAAFCSGCSVELSLFAVVVLVRRQPLRPGAGHASVGFSRNSANGSDTPLHLRHISSLPGADCSSKGSLFRRSRARSAAISFRRRAFSCGCNFGRCSQRSPGYSPGLSDQARSGLGAEWLGKWRLPELAREKPAANSRPPAAPTSPAVSPAARKHHAPRPAVSPNESIFGSSPSHHLGA